MAFTGVRFALIILLTGFLWGALVKVALAEHYHVNCVGHGFVHGEATTCASTAHVYSAGLFSDHVHKAHNWCG